VPKKDILSDKFVAGVRVGMAMEPTVGPPSRVRTLCEVCRNHVHLMCYKGTGVCSQRCEKVANREQTPIEAFVGSVKQ
jgi:hypothetical protein